MKSLTRLIFTITLMCVILSTGCTDFDFASSSQYSNFNEQVAKTRNALKGTTWNFYKAEVGDGTETVTLTDGCPTLKYANSVRDLSVTFISETSLRIRDNCSQSEKMFEYAVTNELAPRLLVSENADFKNLFIRTWFSFALQADGKPVSRVRLVFEELQSPALTWEYSPTMFFEKQ